MGTPQAAESGHVFIRDAHLTERLRQRFLVEICGLCRDRGIVRMSTMRRDFVGLQQAKRMSPASAWNVQWSIQSSASSPWCVFLGARYFMAHILFQRDD